MNMKKQIESLFLVSCLMFFFHGCSPVHLRTLAKETLELSQFGSILDDSLVFKARKVIALETNDISLIRRIERLCLDGDTLAVFDRSLNKVVVFGSDGHYICSIHDIGPGPAEYMQVSDICMDRKNKQIVLLCDPYKFMYYTYSGKFIKEVNLPSYNSAFVINNNMIYCDVRADNGESVLHIYDKSAKLVDEARIPFSEPFKTDTPSSTTNLNDGKNLTLGKDVYFTRQFDNSIYVFSQGEVHLKYTIDFREHQMPSKLNMKYDSGFDFLDECHEKKYIFSITDVMENDNKLLFKTNLGICLYDKVTKELNSFRFIKNKGLGGGVSDVMTMNDGEHLAVKYNSDMFRKRIDNSQERNLQIDEDLLKVYNSINDESNPVLMIYQF